MTSNKTNKQVLVAAIAAIGALGVAFFQYYPFKDVKKSDKVAESSLILAGSVVERATNDPVGQADISIVGIHQGYFSEDNGNFRIEIKGHNSVRVRVTKRGYQPFDKSFDLPSEGTLIVLTPDNQAR